MLEGRCAEVENQNDSKQVSKVWKIFSLVFFRGNITTVDSIYLCFFCPYFSQKQNVKESQIKPIKANRQCLLTVWMNTVHKLLQSLVFNRSAMLRPTNSIPVVPEPLKSTNLRVGSFCGEGTLVPGSKTKVLDFSKRFWIPGSCCWVQSPSLICLYLINYMNVPS